MEAAGDKFVARRRPELSEDEKRTAIEAVGDKDVFAPADCADEGLAESIV